MLYTHKTEHLNCGDMDNELQRLDQEITLELQKIDGNLGHCFGVITKEIIPKVMEYGAVCDEIMDSCQWLGTLCRHSGTVDLDTLQPPPLPQQQQQQREPHHATILDDGNTPGAEGRALSRSKSNTTRDLDNGSEEEEDDHDEGTTRLRDEDDSVQRLKKRKVSLLIQERYGSSSSAMPSPERGGAGHVRGDEPSSSPAKDNVPVPGTVIHFSTK